MTSAVTLAPLARTHTTVPTTRNHVVLGSLFTQYLRFARVGMNVLNCKLEDSIPERLQFSLSRLARTSNIRMGEAVSDIGTLLRPEDIDQFRREGVLVIKNFLTNDEVADARKGKIPPAVGQY